MPKSEQYWLERIWEMLTGNAGTGIDGDISVTGVPVVASEDWRSSIQVEETVNDTDKTLGVPALTEWQILNLWVELTSSATVGDRQIVVEAQDSSGDVIGQSRAGAVQAASLTRYYNFSPPCADLLGFRDTDYLMTPLGFWVLPPQSIVRVYDNNAVDNAADDMIVQMLVATRAVE